MENSYVGAKPDEVKCNTCKHFAVIMVWEICQLHNCIINGFTCNAYQKKDGNDD